MNEVFAPVLAAIGADAFAAPGRLPWLLLLAAAALALSLARPLASIAWPGLAEARAAGGLGRDPLRLFALLLRGGALGLLALALAEPVGTRAAGRRRHDGLDMVLVLDLSGSMRAADAEVHGEARSRFDLAREAVTRFALHRVAEGDRVGLVVFGGRAYTQSPLTTDGKLLAAALGRVSPGAPNEPTALGEGLALAVRRVTAGAEATATPESGPEKGRVIVLLTDGRSNAGVVPIDVAASIAAARRIRVHTVGIGADRHGALDHAGAAARGHSLTDLDAETLQRVAKLCDGRFFHARRSDDLEAVYAEIDALERVARDVPEPARRTPRAEPLLALAGALSLAELLAARVLWRRIP